MQEDLTQARLVSSPTSAFHIVEHWIEGCSIIHNLQGDHVYEKTQFSHLVHSEMTV